jgi:hypothetical protein
VDAAAEEEEVVGGVEGFGELEALVVDGAEDVFDLGGNLEKSQCARTYTQQVRFSADESSVGKTVFRADFNETTLVSLHREQQDRLNGGGGSPERTALPARFPAIRE